MGACDFPRINFKGLLEIDVATANNDDYSGEQFPAGSPFAGEPLRLADSVTVQPERFDMTDQEWIEWAQAPHPFFNPANAKKNAKSRAADPTSTRNATLTKAERVRSVDGEPANTTAIPAEWNYYGDMGLTMRNVSVLSVQTGIDEPIVDPSTEAMVGATVSYDNRPDDTGRSTAMLIDVNPESVPSSQVFSDDFMLAKDGVVYLHGKPTKACTRWINFQRNTNLGGPNGAAATFYCVVPLSELEGQPIVDFMKRGPVPAGKKLAGVSIRYVMYRALQPVNIYKYPGDAWFNKMVEIYAAQGTNPDIAELQGTITPWYEDEFVSGPTGRVLLPTTNTFPLPPGSRGNGSRFRLAPATVNVDRETSRVSIDCASTFPDHYLSSDFDPTQTGDDPKFDFGAVHLVVRDPGGATHDFGAIPYTDTDAGDRRGWLFDFSTIGVADDLLTAGDFVLTSTDHGDLLVESEYLIASDQSCLYGEQDPSGSTTDRFMSDAADPDSASVRVFRKGVELCGAAAPKLSMWSYDTTPNQVPGSREPLAADLAPGEPISVPVKSSGTRLLTFTLPGESEPPANSNGLDLMVIPQINLRLLPNDEDFGAYYVDSSAENPVGNDSLTFEVIYEKVLRNYYLLYPAMSLGIPLNDPAYWRGAEMAGRLFQRTQKSWFAKRAYMPRTRDLSDSRRALLHAWCRKYLGAFDAKGVQA